MKSSRRALLSTLLLFALALTLRLYYVNIAQVDQPIRADAAQYVRYALNLIQHHVFSLSTVGHSAPQPDSYRSPGYPAFLALAMRARSASGDWYTLVLIAQSVMGAAIAALTMTIARLIGLSFPLSVGAGSLAAIWPHSVTINGYLLTETLFASLLLLSVALLVRARDRNSSLTAWAAGIALGLAALVNITATPLAILGAWILLRHGALKLSVIFMLATLAFPMGWELRNALNVDGGQSSTTRASQNLVEGSWPTYHSAYRSALHGDPVGQTILAAIAEEERQMRISPASGLATLFVRFQEDPGYYLRWYLIRKPALLWGWDIKMGQGDIYQYPTRNSPFDQQPILRMLTSLCHGANAILGLLMAAYCMVIAMRLRFRGPNHQLADHSLAQAWLVGILLYYTALHTILQAEPRFAIPLRPLQFIAAMAALDMARSFCLKSRKSALIK